MQQHPTAALVEERALIPYPFFNAQRAWVTAQDVSLDRRAVGITFDTGGEGFRISLARRVADPVGFNELDTRRVVMTRSLLVGQQRKHITAAQYRTPRQILQAIEVLLAGDVAAGGFRPGLEERFSLALPLPGLIFIPAEDLAIHHGL
nr:hypothetical protein [Pseudomonas sp. W2I6]